MKYYVTADIHGFFDEFCSALDNAGYYKDTEPHKLVICGDLFDRGQQALKLQKFILSLLENDDVILIKGNHENLTLNLLSGWNQKSYLQSHHFTNGTLDTVLQLTNNSFDDLLSNPDTVGRNFLQSPYIQTIIPSMLDYYETPHYIFTHGWIPCTAIHLDSYHTEYAYMDNWRHAHEKAWDVARWQNGMEAAHSGVTETGKTIVCGHWHCSFGHARYEGKGGEFDDAPDFTPYYADGIIALDACTAKSRRVNCIVIDD